LVDGQWTKVRELRINNQWYNVTTPCLSPDGKKLYFASDEPGGFGGSDIYYSIWKDERWEDPVNLGPVVNTKGNESYPFINSAGELFFSSDGHPGFGGKDIFFSTLSDTTWSEPVRLDPPINSAHDDFGMVTDPLMHNGFFSSNRDKTIDIFQFHTNTPQILYSQLQRNNQYCISMADSGAIVIDTLNLRFVWAFGDGGKSYGLKVKHCFPGSGVYKIRQDILDKSTGRLFFTKSIYSLEIQDYKQPYINSSDYAVKGDTVKFDGLRSNLPGYKIVSYLWNFRDGGKATGEKTTHTFKKIGEYLVNMELVIKSLSTGEVRKTGVSKKVIVLDDKKGVNSYLSRQNTGLPVELTKGADNVRIRTLFSAGEDFKKDAVYNVELLSTSTRIGVNNAAFRSVPKKYTITEKYNQEDSTYAYVVDQQTTLMATYPAYSELYALGFKNVRIRTSVLNDPSEKELHNLIKINGAFADSYFDATNRLTSNAYVMLDQIVKLMNGYPAVKLEVAVHSDNTGLPEASLALSQTRAQMLVSYLISRGINSRRLVATGFGGTKPIASNVLEKDRKLNRRIDFILFK
jgi:outer membrane protein OmpA-like peptidoglycan-associated protein